MFVEHDYGIIDKKYLLNQRLKIFSSHTFFQKFCSLGFCIYMHCFEIILYMVYVIDIFLHMDRQLFYHSLLKKLPFYTELTFHLCQKSTGHTCVGAFLDFILFYRSICLFVYFDGYTALSGLL